MDLVFNLNGSATYLDVCCSFLLQPVPCCRSQHPPAGKSKSDRNPFINLVPLILETTGRPGQYTRKFISNLMKDADNPPLAIRDTWSSSRAYSIAPSPNNNSCRYVTLRTTFAILCSAFFAVPRYVKCWYRPYEVFSLKLAPVEPCGPAVMTPLPTTTSTTPTTLCYSFADAYIAPALHAGLSEVDELKTALGCRFAMDIFTIAQQDRPSPDPVPLPLDPHLEPSF